MDSAWETAFRKLHERADIVRETEKGIIKDYVGGLTKGEIKIKYNCTSKYLQRVIECYGGVI